MIPKAVFAVLPSMQNVFNPSYDANESYESYYKYGSRKYFNTNCSINGEYFTSRTDNRYFRIIDKNLNVKDISGITHFFPSPQLPEQMYDKSYDPDKHAIMFLEFTKNKSYFVESNQSITIHNPDVTILFDLAPGRRSKDPVALSHIDDLLTRGPRFVPLPEDVM